ncbi:MAG: hypothetical protein AAF242_13690 [Bacteroidota bacterium]
MNTRYPLSIAYFLVLSFFCGLFLWSCLDQIDFDVPQGLDEGLVVQASMVRGRPTIVEVQLNRLFNFTIPSLNQVNADQIFIWDEEGNSLELTRRGIGFYTVGIPDNHPFFKIAHYKKYFLQILMPGGIEIVSAPEQLLPVPKADSISRRVEIQTVLNEDNEEVDDTLVAFYLHTPLTTEANDIPTRFRIGAQRTYKITERPLSEFELANGFIRQTCYITSDVEVLVPQSFDGSISDASYLSNFPLPPDQLNHYYIEGYYYTAFLESLSEGAHRHFSELEQTVQRTGSMFESPVGRLFSNFTNLDNPKNTVYGYFYVTERSLVRKYIPTQTLVPNDTFCNRSVWLECPMPPCYPLACTACEMEPGSTIFPPEWWVE